MCDASARMLVAMPVTLDLPPEARARLEAEAARRGITLDQLVVELSNQFSSSGTSGAHDALGRFLGCGDSDDPTWATRDIHELRHDLAQRSSEIV